jgi:DNA-binding NarL/FixJ family response regulator
VKAVDDVLHHRTYVTPRMARLIEEDFVRTPGPNQQMQLTKRQTEIIQLLVEGYTMKEAGAMLKIKPRTVAYHKYQIMDFYGLKTHADFVMFAIKHHIVEPPASSGTTPPVH